MNLGDVFIPYQYIGSEVLKIRTKSAVLMALELYRSADNTPLQRSVELKPKSRHERYRRTQLFDIQWELIRVGILSENLDCIRPEETFMVPSQFNYGDLGLGELKTYLALFIRNKHSRTPFRFQTLREIIARDSHLTLRNSRNALRGLEQRGLIKVRQAWREGVTITLLDPMHGEVPLYEIGAFYRDNLNEMGVHERYRYLLKDFDPKHSLANMHSPQRDYGVICPFCGGGSEAENKRRFRFNSEDDHWFCHNCKRGGDSVRLWGRLYWRLKREEDRASRAILSSIGKEQNERSITANA
jgi:hypothetical protein